MQPSLPPCPECGGPQALFWDAPASMVPVSAWRSVPLHACICVRCGHTTLRVLQNDLEPVRKAAEKGKRSRF